MVLLTTYLDPCILPATQERALRRAGKHLLFTEGAAMKPFAPTSAHFGRSSLGTFLVRVTGITCAVVCALFAGRPHLHAQGQAALADCQVTPAVVVRATAPALNNADANVATDISEQQVVELPLHFRSPYFLVSINSNTHRGQVWQAFNIGAMTSGPGADQDAGAF